MAPSQDIPMLCFDQDRLILRVNIFSFKKYSCAVAFSKAIQPQLREVYKDRMMLV